MQLTLKMMPSDFENLRAFEKAVKKQLGNNVYVGSDSMCLYFDYPKEVVERLRPYFKKDDINTQLEFTLDSSLPDAKK